MVERVDALHSRGCSGHAHACDERVSGFVGRVRGRGLFQFVTFLIITERVAHNREELTSGCDGRAGVVDRPINNASLDILSTRMKIYFLTPHPG